MPVLAALFVFPVICAFAQTEDNPQRLEIYVSPVIEVLSYSMNTPALGAGLTFGAGDEVSIGARFLYAFDGQDLQTMELSLFMRFYIFGFAPNTGLFVQVMGGASLFEYKNTVSIPTQVGSLSFGLSAGWRFIFFDSWFAEPQVRLGYPYRFSLGASAGYRF